MQSYLFKDIQVVNEGKIRRMDVLTNGEHIEKIDPNITVKHKVIEINGENKHLFPGVIDDQVHFREPGLTHKATIHSESMAAVAGPLSPENPGTPVPAIVLMTPVSSASWRSR